MNVISVDVRATGTGMPKRRMVKIIIGAAPDWSGVR